jgi:hypothetical protein
VTSLERNEPGELEVFNAGVAVAARYGQRARRLNVNLMVKRAGKIPAECVGTCMEVERAYGVPGHKHILNPI